MFRKYLVGLMSVLVIGALLVSACTTKNPPPNSGGGTTPPTAEKKPAPGGEVIFDAPEDPDTLAMYWLDSAYAAEITDRIYGSGLVKIGIDYKPVPNLAEKLPEVSADGLTYTFKIRSGIKWNDGQALTAKDLEFSYNVMLNPEAKSPDSGSYDMIKEVKAADESTFTITLKEKFAPFLFGGAGLQPIPKHIWEKIAVKDMQASELWKKNPVGAGPYTLVEWKPGQHVLVKRNPTYWEFNTPGVKGGVNGPWVETIRMRIIGEDDTAIAALEAGELSFKGNVVPTHVKRLKTEFQDKLASFDWNRMGYGYQMFNTQKFPTDIKEVRQALSYGLNRQAILEGVMEKRASIPAGFIPPIHWAFDKNEKGYLYNQKTADDLIQKAGGKKNAQGIYEIGGKPLKLKYVATKGSPVIDGIALQSQKDWKAIGVDIELQLVDFNVVLDAMKKGDFNVTFSGLGFSTDPHYSFDGNYHSRNVKLDAKGVNTGSNRARYVNKAVDALIDQGKVETDITKRLKIYQDAQRMIIEDAPANWIYVNQYTDFAKKEIQGIVNWDGYGINSNWRDQWYLSTN